MIIKLLKEIMLKSILTLSLSVIFTSMIFAQQADIIVGKYRLPNNLDVEIFENSGKYYGKIIALNGFEDGQQKDIKNPDRSQRNDPLLGKLIIKDLEYDKDKKKWINGSIYGAEKGLHLNLLIAEVRADEIVVVGSKFIMKKSLEWKKL
ncbi:MAG: DUF2147 domain-containing protein [Bacteroidetes bacterium]|nr:MAG: DUF2147 domain-containing protein [Bacteroidota bacterium]